MVKHIVQWKLKEAEGRSARENAAYIKGRLEQLPGMIPELLHLEAHLDTSGNDANGDLVLITHTRDFAALKAYQMHPEHQKVGQYLKKAALSRSCVDYETEGETEE